MNDGEFVFGGDPRKDVGEGVEEVELVGLLQKIDVDTLGLG